VKSKNALALILLLGLSLVGCGRISQQGDAAPDVNIDLAVDPEPLSVGPTRLTITLADADSKPIEGARLQIKGDMTHPGMQPVLAEGESSEEGTYETPFEWTMGGDWIVTVTANLPDGRITARQFNFTVEGDMRNMDMMQTEATQTP
jgi:hypothetical protein